MPDVQLIKWKVCLVGEAAVGKTSMIRRFVFDQFDETYRSTFGTKVTKREMKMQHPKDNRELNIVMMIWDIMGQKGFRHLLKDAYFFGTRGIIAMCDVTRRETYDEMNGWMETALTVTSEIPVVFLGNKCDLEAEQQIKIDELKNLASGYKQSEAYLTSVKTGYNVDLVFQTLCEKMLEDLEKEES